MENQLECLNIRAFSNSFLNYHSLSYSSKTGICIQFIGILGTNQILVCSDDQLAVKFLKQATQNEAILFFFQVESFYLIAQSLNFLIFLYSLNVSAISLTSIFSSADTCSILCFWYYILNTISTLREIYKESASLELFIWLMHMFLGSTSITLLGIQVFLKLSILFLSCKYNNLLE